VDLGALGSAEAAAAMLAGQAAALAAIEPELPAIADAIVGIADRVTGGGRLVLIGAGNSGRMALIQSPRSDPPSASSPAS